MKNCNIISHFFDVSTYENHILLLLLSLGGEIASFLRNVVRKNITWKDIFESSGKRSTKSRNGVENIDNEV